MQPGPEWQLTPERAAIHLPTRTVIVADLHLGYDHVRRRGGEAIPRRGMATELAPLRALLHREKLTRLVLAGDLFEDARHRREEMLGELRQWIEETGAELVAVIPGNHDRGLDDSSVPLHRDGFQLGDWHIIHGDRGRPPGKIVQGHEHPSLRWGVAQGPCFLWTESHLVLPAYSRDAAGGNVLSMRRWDEYHCTVIADARLLEFGTVAELRRRLRERGRESETAPRRR